MLDGEDNELVEVSLTQATRREFFIGLDLGQMRDPCALAVLERYQLLLLERDPVTQERVSVWEHRLQSLRTFPLGTAYSEVIAHITELAQELRALPGVSGWGLAVDATGGGIPVVEYLRAARPRCRINAVTITG